MDNLLEAQFNYKAENETSDLEIIENKFVLREDGVSHSSCLLCHLWALLSFRGEKASRFVEYF